VALHGNGGRPYDQRIARERELVKPPPTLGSLEEISKPAIAAMALAGTIAVLDGIAGPGVVLVGLLAIPPVIAAMSSSQPETGIVAGVSLVLALLSALWNPDVETSTFVVEVLTVVAGGVASLWIASLRARLFREQEAAELMAETGRLMELTLDRDARADQLADLAVPALGDVAMVDMLTPEGHIARVASRGRDTSAAEAFSKLRAEIPIAPDGPHPVALAIRTGEPQAFGPLSEEQIEEITTKESERELIRRHRFQSCLVLPLHARGSVLGTLSLWIMRPTNAFDDTARRAAERLAQRAAMALDNARLHEQQAHIAGVLQRSLRPRSLPEIPGFEIASRFQAAGEAYEVGGDFYDAFRAGSGSWSIVIGDVCGKGPEAAGLTSLARHTIRTATAPDTSPSDVLRVLHDSIRAERSDLRFCTAALLHLDTPSNGDGVARLMLSLGGHPPPIALRSDGSVEPIGEPGTLLGAIPDPSVADAATTLAPGESLLLYTDGMLATHDGKSADDPEWLGRQLAEAAGESAEEIAARLSTAAIERQGGEPRDDIAVLVLQRGGRA
jgi:serine phosphatase RsbU (regulator of sigma subunit)